MSAAAAEAAVATRGPTPSPEAVRRQRVKVPWRLVESAGYEDVTLAVYVKVKALQRPLEGCEARVETIAGYLGLSAASVARGTRQLTRPAPGDDVVEMKSRRRTMPGGRGTSATRWTRPITRTEPFVWIPVAAAEQLTPRQLRAYAVIAYAQARGTALTLPELAGFLRHHSGKKAGQTVSTTATAGIVDVLEASRWITVGRRTGHQGRHRFTAHTLPPAARPHGADGEAEEAVDSPEHTEGRDEGARASSQDGERSGPQVDERSLAYRESPRTDSLEDAGESFSPAVGEVQIEEVVENPPLASAPDVADRDTLALRADANTTPTHEPPQRRTGPTLRTYDGPELTLSTRTWAVLEPVRSLMRRCNIWEQRRVAREAGCQLDQGMDAERLRRRLERRFAAASPSEIRRPGGWLLAVALPRWGCGHLDCEEGVLWSTGRRCVVCEDIVADRRRQQRLDLGLCPDHGTQPGPSGACEECEPMQVSEVLEPGRREPEGPPRGTCCGCGCRILLTGSALGDGLCTLCREEAAAPTAPALANQAQPAKVVLCQGLNCAREALPTRTVCVRHRAQELVQAAA